MSNGSVPLKPRKDKAQVMQSSRLQGRRDNREIDELNVTIAALEKEVDSLKSKLAGGEGKGKSEGNDKQQQKDLADLQKKIRRLESDRDKAIDERDALADELKTAKAALEGDARLTKVTKELFDAQSQVSQLQAKLKSVQEEGEIFQTRVRQLEQGTTSTADIKREKEKRAWEESTAKKEDKIARLGADKVNLCGQLKAARAKQDQLEQLKNSLERENGRLSREVEAFGNKASSANGSRSATSHTCTAEERKRLTDRIAELEKLAKSREHRDETLMNGGHPSTPTQSATNLVNRYRSLVENLRLSEDDVSTLLSEGPDWPPVRGQMRSSSLLDLLWLLQDEQDEADDDKKQYQEKIAKLEQDVLRQKRRADAIEARAKVDLEEARGRAAAVAGGRTPPESREDSPSMNGLSGSSTGDLKAEMARKERETEKLQETIVQLEARVAAFELSGSSDRSPSPSRFSSRGLSISISGGQAQDFVRKLSKTVMELNDEIAALRMENTELLLKMVDFA
ncbi:hypothetical protein JCM11251_002045 [Rhodosporidiobolus azoricus]